MGGGPGSCKALLPSLPQDFCICCSRCLECLSISPSDPSGFIITATFSLPQPQSLIIQSVLLCRIPNHSNHSCPMLLSSLLSVVPVW